ncbi:MAG: hypothetical protein KKF30_13335 [Proteobacteria bacterium]|nr:hypothetical protein [Pseudomonadota bacterium]MBU4468945.1 hypothetical protein [Pseudomonadota bacterium]MCG2751181.1 hypothetical protein [Desulfobacteraceae bacterium]
MQEPLVNAQSSRSRYTHGNCIEHYSSVEIFNACTTFCYHFKLWWLDKNAMCILVKEDSQIISKLKEGDRMNMKYYGSQGLSDSEFRETAIQWIRKADNGRFKGHYLVYLDILN